MDSAGFFGGAEAEERDPHTYDSYGRYMLDADGKGKKAYTRATTLAKTLENTFGLGQWTTKKVAKGVAQSPALTARAAIAKLDDKAVWKEIITAAEVLSGGDEKRDLGSAFHEFHERVGDMTDEEYAAVDENLRITYQRYRAELARLGIEEVLTEATVVNQAIGTAGKLDGILRLSDGRLVVGDRKSGRVTEYPHAAACQMAIYANADVIISYDESGATMRTPMPELDTSMGLVIDITIGDADTAEVHVYEVDLMAGWYGALLATKVRRWRNRKDLLTPYQPETRWEPRGIPDMPPPDGLMVTQSDIAAAKALEPAPLTEHQRETLLFNKPPVNEVEYTQADLPAAASPEDPEDFTEQISAAFEPTPQMAADQATRDEREARIAAKAAGHPAFSSAQGKNIMVGPDGTEVVPEQPSGDLTARYAPDAAALLAQYKTKAALQGAARAVDSSMAVNRTRNNLAKDIAAHPRWPSLRDEVLGITYTVTDAELSSVSGMVVTHQTDVVGEDLPAMAQESSVPEADNPFRAAEPEPESAPLSPDEVVLLRIGEAATTDALGDVWDYAQANGIPWSPRLDQAAKIRMNAITSSH